MKAFVLKSLKYTKEKWPFILILILAITVAYLLINKDTSTSSGKIDTIVISDKRCADCDTTYLVSQLKTVFPAINVKELDYSSREGKDLYEKNKLGVLPAVLFTDTIKSDKNYAQVEKFLISTGNYLSLNIGSTFNPTKEICDNKIDDTNNGKIDCDDEDCKGSLACRPEIKNNLQVFIMSDCPYGKEAIKVLKEVIANFGTALTYDVHYIARIATEQEYNQMIPQQKSQCAKEDDGKYYCSLHGPYEVDEDIVQLCTKKYSPNQWFNYLYCRSTKGIKGIDWKNCAKETGTDAEKIEACFKGTEGKELLRQDIKIADSLGVSGSPTWLANNRYSFGGIATEPVKASFCKYNKDTKGCENALSTATAVSGSC